MVAYIEYGKCKVKKRTYWEVTTSDGEIHCTGHDKDTESIRFLLELLSDLTKRGYQLIFNIS